MKPPQGMDSMEEEEWGQAFHVPQVLFWKTFMEVQKSPSVHPNAKSCPCPLLTFLGGLLHCECPYTKHSFSRVNHKLYDSMLSYIYLLVRDLTCSCNHLSLTSLVYYYYTTPPLFLIVTNCKFIKGPNIRNRKM